MERLENPDGRYDADAFLRFQTFTVAFFRMRETLWLNYVDGVVDTEQWETYRAVLVNMLQTSENVRASWDLYSPRLAPGFTREIDALLFD